MVVTNTDLTVTGISVAFLLAGLALLPSQLPNPTIEDGEFFNLSYEVISKEGQTYDSPETGKVYRLLWAEKRGEDLHCHVALKEIRGYNIEIRQSNIFGFEEESMQSWVVWGNDGVTPLLVFDLEFICPDL